MSTLKSSNMLSGGQACNFCKRSLKKKVCFPYAFLRLSHFGSKTDFLMKFLDDSAWLRLVKLKNIFFKQKTWYLTQKSWKYPQNPKDNGLNQNILENIGFPRVPCGPAGLWNLTYLYHMYIFFFNKILSVLT